MTVKIVFLYHIDTKVLESQEKIEPKIAQKKGIKKASIQNNTCLFYTNKI